MIVSRWCWMAARLGAFAIVLGLLATPAVAELPIGALKNWSALSLDGGMLLHKESGNHGGVDFVFVYQQLDNAGSDLRFLAYQGTDDVDAAVASLITGHRFNDADIKTLTAYAPGHQTTSSISNWAPLTFGQSYDIADDPGLGSLGSEMDTFLLALEALLYPAKATSDELYVAQANLCQFSNVLRNEMITELKVASSNKAATSNQTYLQSAGRYCAGVWPPPPGTVPAFPLPPAMTPPTGPIQWSGTGCGVDQLGDRENCISSATGDLCQCDCSPVGQGFSWKPVPGSCAAIPVTPGPGVPGGPNGCTPNGGKGPCSNAGGDTCVCSCVANGAPPPADVWGNPIDCGSETLGLAFLFAVLGGSWWIRRRLV